MNVDAPLELLRGEGIGIHQKRKLFELRNEYSLTDATGAVVGTASQERQNVLVKAVRIVSSLDVALPVELDVVDAAGTKVLEINKPWMTWRCDVSSVTGPVGSITKKVRLGKARFVLTDAGGAPAGEVQARNWRARDFEAVAPDGRPFARVTKNWRGLLTEAFTDADSYAVAFAPEASPVQRALAFASALAVDLVMKQKDSS
jgi:uncharacterized protein YxjI